MELLNEEIFRVGATSITAFWIIKFILIVVFGFVFAKFFKRKILKIDNEYITPQKKLTVANLGYYLIAIGVMTVGFTALGIDLSSFTIIAGAISVGLGFGLQTLISNFASGIVLAFEGSLKVGDLIRLTNGDIGRVKAVNMRSTIITTADNVDIFVPNSTFITQNIVNFTYKDDTRRLQIPFKLPVDVDIESIKKIVLEEVLNSNLLFVRDDENQKPDVRLMVIEKDLLEFALVVYVRSNSPSSSNFEFLPIIRNAIKKSSLAKQIK